MSNAILLWLTSKCSWTDELRANNLCLEVAGTIEPCEGKALVSSDNANVDDNKTDPEIPRSLCTFSVGDSSKIPL